MKQKTACYSLPSCQVWSVNPKWAASPQWERAAFHFASALFFLNTEMKFNKSDKKPNDGLVATTLLVQSLFCFFFGARRNGLINSIEIQNMPWCDSSECLAGLSAHWKRNDTICGTRGSLRLRKDPFMLQRCEHRNVHSLCGWGEEQGGHWFLCVDTYARRHSGERRKKFQRREIRAGNFA